MQRALEAVGPDKTCQLILCVQPQDNPSHYAAIKRASDIKLGVLSQRILRGARGNLEMTKLALRMNVKLGGE